MFIYGVTNDFRRRRNAGISLSIINSIPFAAPIYEIALLNSEWRTDRQTDQTEQQLFSDILLCQGSICYGRGRAASAKVQGAASGCRHQFVDRVLSALLWGPIKLLTYYQSTLQM